MGWECLVIEVKIQHKIATEAGLAPQPVESYTHPSEFKMYWEDLDAASQSKLKHVKQVISVVDCVAFLYMSCSVLGPRVHMESYVCCTLGSDSI